LFWSHLQLLGMLLELLGMLLELLGMSLELLELEPANSEMSLSNAWRTASGGKTSQIAYHAIRQFENFGHSVRQVDGHW
jgi:hypothetical protein